MPILIFFLIFNGLIFADNDASKPLPRQDKKLMETPNTKPLSPQKFNFEKLSEKGKTAYQSLLSADSFEEGHIGYSGTLSKYVESFGVLLQEKSADEAFKSLLNEATLAGKLYALCGLYFTDYNSFKIEAEKFKNSDELVKNVSGCEISNEKVSKIVESKSPIVAIIEPTQTIEEWRKLNQKTYSLDIINGGFPATFKSFAKLK